MFENAFTRHAKVRYPVIGGAMYPCSNPELVAAVSKAGGLGIVQPIALVYAHKNEFRAGLRKIHELSGGQPIGLNLLIEGSSKIYLERNRRWMETALEEGVRFFVTALGDPRWVVDIAKSAGAVVYHDVTERKWADKAVKAGVDGLICVNRRAGGHAGELAPAELFASLKDLGLPLICAGGIGGPKSYQEALATGYSGVQLGTRMIATTECNAHADYKAAIVKATADDIVLTRRLTGVPVAIIKTDFVERTGTDAGPLGRLLLKGAKTKHLARMFYGLRSIWQLKKSMKEGSAYKDYFQAGKSVEDISGIMPVADVFAGFVAATPK